MAGKNVYLHGFWPYPLALRPCVGDTRKKIPNFPFFDIFRLPPLPLKSTFFCALRIAIMRSPGKIPFQPLDGLTNLSRPPITPPANPGWPGHQLFADKFVEFGMVHARIVQHRRQAGPGRVIVGQRLNNASLCPSRGGYASSGHGGTSGSVRKGGLERKLSTILPRFPRLTGIPPLAFLRGFWLSVSVGVPLLHRAR